MKRLTISIGDQVMQSVALEAQKLARSKAFVIRQIVKAHFARIDSAAHER